MPTLPWKPDSNAFNPSSPLSVSCQDLDRLERDLAATSPAAFAWGTSNGRWQMAKHLKILNQSIMETLAGVDGIRRLLVTMPPRHGKSELCSKFLPAWFLGTYPDWRVILTSYEASFAAEWGRKSRTVLEQHGQRIFGIQVAKSPSAADQHLHLPGVRDSGGRWRQLSSVRLRDGERRWHGRLQQPHGTLGLHRDCLGVVRLDRVWAAVRSGHHLRQRRLPALVGWRQRWRLRVCLPGVLGWNHV